MEAATPMATRQQADVLASAAAGDEIAFQHIIAAHHEDLRRVCRAISGDHTIADDAPVTIADGLKVPLKDLTWHFVSNHVTDIFTASEQEIIDAMNVEIKQLNYDRDLLRGSLDSLDEAYRGQIRVAANQQRAGQAVGDESARVLAELKSKMAKNARELAALDLREQKIREEFQAQLERYRALLEQYAEEGHGS